MLLKFKVFKFIQQIPIYICLELVLVLVLTFNKKYFLTSLVVHPHTPYLKSSHIENPENFATQQNIYFTNQQQFFCVTFHISFMLPLTSWTDKHNSSSSEFGSRCRTFCFEEQQHRSINNFNISTSLFTKLSTNIQSHARIIGCFVSPITFLYINA